MNDYHWGPGLRLSSFSVRGFKSLSDVRLDLAPLTVLVGANSVGKSSVLQAMLLVVQSALRGDGYQGVVPLNGYLVRLGRFDDLRTAGSAERSAIRLEWEMRGAVERRSDAEVLQQIRALLWSSDGSEAEPPVLHRASLELTDGPAGHADIREVSLGWESASGTGTRIGAKNRVTWTSMWESESFDASRPTECEVTRWTGFLPQEVEVHVKDPDWLAANIVDLLQAKVRFPNQEGISLVGRLPLNRDPAPNMPPPTPDLGGEPTPEEIEHSVDWALAEAGVIPFQDTPLQPPPVRGWHPQGPRDAWYALLRERLESRPWHYPATQGIPASTNVQGFWSNRVKYLGPLRAEPRVSYEYGGRLHGVPIGARGESWPEALEYDSVREPRPLPPGTPNQDCTPLEAVNKWIEWFELGDPLRIRSSKHGVEPETGKRDFTTVGTGLSQAIPVLAICMLAAEGDLILLEQPEVHLHPKVQQKLGDFLVAVAKSGRRLVVETHSEYLITRLRLNAAVDPANKKYFSIYFATRNQEEHCEFRRIEIDDLGGVPEWPPGFFDEGTDEMREMLKAVVRRRLDNLGTEPPVPPS